MVLVVDDEHSASERAEAPAEDVSRRPPSVIEATNGDDALQRAAADQPDVIVLDLRMPGMLGTEVLARLKRERQTADIPVIIATSQILDDVERQRLANHAVAILSKARIGEGDGNNEIRRAIQSAGLTLRAERPTSSAQR